MTGYEGYRLVDAFPESETKVYLLANGPNDSDTALGKLASKKSGRTAAQKVYSTLAQLSRVGAAVFEQDVRKMRRLDADLVEVKVGGAVVRAMCHHRHGVEVVVVIDVFEGHGGKSGNVQRHIDAARAYVPVVERLLEESR